jgi:hypothetical protein
LVYHSISLFPSSYIIHFQEFSSILYTNPNQCNLFSLTVSVLVFSFTNSIGFRDMFQIN